MKIMINGKEYTCTTKKPHGDLREMMINAMLDGQEVKIIEE